MHNLVLRNASIVDVRSGRLYKGDILIEDGRIAQIGSPADSHRGMHMIDVSGEYVSPGLIDSHLHIESSMLNPVEFSKEAVKHGTTAVFVDPHEIANVRGRKGVELFLEQSDLVPLDMHIGIPSCVPATHLEDSGGRITLQDIRELISDPRVYGLAEMMNFHGIVHGAEDARDKVDLVHTFGKIVDGHCPGLSGQSLTSYITNGKNDGIVRIGSDHECTSAREAFEKHKAGMCVAIRYGTAAKDLDRILPGLFSRPDLAWDRFMVCSDDLDATELSEEGHVDRVIRRARQIILQESDLNQEQATILALTLATLNPARYFSRFLRFHNHPEIGRIEVGAKANLVVFDSLEKLTVDKVIYAGRLVVDQGEYVEDGAEYDYSDFLRSVNVGRRLSPSDFKIRYAGRETSRIVKVIGLIEGSLDTQLLELPFEIRDGEIKPSVEDTAKIAVFERHRATGSYAIGFVKGLGIRRGAIASTIAHDSHNLIVAGVDDECMTRAANCLSEEGGGIAVARDDHIDYLPLEIGGLMSTSGIENVVRKHRELTGAVETLGYGLRNTLMTMSFLALPVIPKLRITNRGLVDVDEFRLVELY